jgi:hypothetical protein
MADTLNFGLPLVQPSQAQKHITVNEALARLDALALLCLQSIDVLVPPTDPLESTAWGVPAGATGSWSGLAGQVAIFLNGGWVSVPARIGWRAFVFDRSCEATWDGYRWLTVVGALSHGGATSGFQIIEGDVSTDNGGSVVSGLSIPSNSVVLGVTARVVQAITGSLEAWQLGTADDNARFGSGLGLAVGSYAIGVSGVPTAVYSESFVVLTAVGGMFSAGRVRVALHLLRIAPPR